MRRSILVLLLVTIAIMLLMAAPAMAKTGTKGGGYWAYSTGAGAFGIDIHGHFYAYPAHGDSTVTSDTPHAGYQTTTGKCKVCHAVHGAGSPATSATGVATERLLRNVAAEACTFCHLEGYANNPYVGGDRTAWQNYNGNDGPTSAGNIWGYPNEETRSGHFKTHGHDNPQGSTLPKSYKGCVSCHAVHGANTIGDKNNILKNDPAKGTISAVGKGWKVVSGVATLATSATEAQGYGSKYAPVTSVTQFCEDCHDGTKLVNANLVNAVKSGEETVATQEKFNTFFPSCGRGINADGTPSASWPLCHNSVQGTITENATQFGAFLNNTHNGRSHIMTTFLDAGYGSATGLPTNEEGANPTVAASSGCTKCHDSNRNIALGATFPHFGVEVNGALKRVNDLIAGYDQILEPDKVCLKCHGTVGTQY